MRPAAVVTGNPVRPEVLTRHPDKAVTALGLHAFDRRLPTVYVTGGAQGSQQINDEVGGELPWLPERANVVHQCSPAHVAAPSARAAGLPAGLAARHHLTPFVGAELPDVPAGRSGGLPAPWPS